MAKFITRRFEKKHEIRPLGGDFSHLIPTESGPDAPATTRSAGTSRRSTQPPTQTEKPVTNGNGEAPKAPSGKKRRRRSSKRRSDGESSGESAEKPARNAGKQRNAPSAPPPADAVGVASTKAPPAPPPPAPPPPRSEPPANEADDSGNDEAAASDAAASDAVESEAAPEPKEERKRRKPVSHDKWDPNGFEVPPVEGKTRFQDLPLPGEILHAVEDLGFEYATPIQAEILPVILDGRDAIGQAQTGTGKTAAFLSALFTNLLRNPPETDRPQGTPRALVIAPTRELAQQIEREAREIGKYSGFRSMAVFGGMDYVKQKRRLEEGAPVDIVVATPGRLIDFMRSRVIDLRGVETMVIDEADRMLDMGFIPDVRRIIRSTPNTDRRQTLFFSATFNETVLRLADQWTSEPHKVVIEPDSIAAETVDQTIFITTIRQQLAIVVNLIKWEKPKRVLIFVNRRDQANSLYRKLTTFGIPSAEMSGAVPQNKRQRVLEDFRGGKITALVATDVAGRGIHIDHIDFVINYHLPDDPEDYVHRIGRTGRAGSEGKAFSFASEDDGMLIPPIEEFINRELPCTYPKDSWLVLPEATHPAPPDRRRRGDSGRGRSGGGRSGGGRSGRSGGNRPRSGKRHR